MATYYIDPSAGVNGTGTEISPYNIIPSLSSNNTYLLKRGTTIAANPTAFEKTNLILGVYGSGPRPEINGGSGRAINSSNSSGLSLSSLRLISSGNYAVSHNGGNSFSADDCEIIGARTGLNVISMSAAISGLSVTNSIIRNTSSVNENTGCFIAAQSGNNIINVTITGNTISGSVGNGLVVKAGDANSLSYIDTLNISNNAIENNVRFGMFVSTGMTSDSADKVCRNVTVKSNQINNNGGPGASITARGGTNLISSNHVSFNNAGGITGTGGLQMAGCTGTIIEHNVSHDNYTTTGNDGVGIYLDVVSGTLPNLGSTGCTVRFNISYNNASFNPGVGTYQGNPPSSGICIYHSHNNSVYKNCCYGNSAGICINAWSNGNSVFENTISDNINGVVYSWNNASSGNTVYKNIITRNARGFFTPDAGNRTTSGNITLSATSGLITITSSSPDFATHTSNYGIKAGDGRAVIISKVTDYQVNAYTLNTFSGTAHNNGAWNLHFGENCVGWNSDNFIYGNTTSFENGVGQSLALGLGDSTANPMLVNPSSSDYHLQPTSPCIGAGTAIAGITTDIDGNQLYPPYNIGPYGGAVGVLEASPTTNPGSAKLNITRISGTSDTMLVSTHTYSLADSAQMRDALGWMWGVDHWAYSDAGVPKVVTGATILSNGIGPNIWANANQVTILSRIKH